MIGAQAILLIPRLCAHPDGFFPFQPVNVVNSFHKVLNAVVIRGRAVGEVVLSGRGAGSMPTAAAVLSDVLWSAQATPALSKAEAMPPHSKMRLLRLALLAQKTRRANLYKESRIAALIPRRTKPHDDPQIDCLLRTAATLGSE